MNKKFFKSLALALGVSASLSVTAFASNDISYSAPTASTEITTQWIEPQASEEFSDLNRDERVAGAFCQVVGVNANSFLNVRSGPGTNFPVIGTLRNGDSVHTRTDGGGGGWTDIWWSTSTGSAFVSSEFIGNCWI